MKHFVKDITDQVTLDLVPSGRRLQVDQVDIVDTGEDRQIKVHIQGIFDMEEETLSISHCTYTHDLDSPDDEYTEWEQFDKSEVKYLEKNLTY